MGVQFKMECVGKLKVRLLVLVDVAKVKMTFSLGSIAIPMFAAMVTSPNLECAEFCHQDRHRRQCEYQIPSNENYTQGPGVLHSYMH